MKPVRWTPHALASLADREIDRGDAERAITGPDRTIPGRGGRQVMLKKYDDPVLHQTMLLCVVTEDQPDERAVVTVYKTSKLDKYLEGAAS